MNLKEIEDKIQRGECVTIEELNFIWEFKTKYDAIKNNSVTFWRKDEGIYYKMRFTK